jgi:Arc/MetJ-type ribon-helix-helix transcriptional regulator
MTDPVDHRRGSDQMVRVSTRIPKPLLDRVDTAVEAGHYENRSVAVRTALRTHLDPSEDHKSPTDRRARRVADE